MCVNNKPVILRLLATTLCVGASSFGWVPIVQAQTQTPAEVVLPPVPPKAKTVAPTIPPVAPAAAVKSVNPAAPSIPSPPTPPGVKPGQQINTAIDPGTTQTSAAPKVPQTPRAQKTGGNDTSEAFVGLQMTPVSENQLNRFVFPEPIEGVYFSEGAPLPECPDGAGDQDPCKPVFLNGKRMMLLQFRAGAKGPVQMLVHLQSGRVLTMNLAPTPSPGAIVRIEGAEDGASDARLLASEREGNHRKTNGMLASEQWVALLARFARGDLPAGFEAEHVGSTVRFDFFDVVPQAAWGNGSDVRVHLFQVRAHGDQPVVINTGLFRTENVKALALDRETITRNAPAFLYVLEHLPEIE